MADIMLYRKTGDWSYRIINPDSEKAWDITANAGSGGLVSNPTYGNTAIALTHDANLGGYKINIPDNLPAGDYDLLLYNVAANVASAGDEVAVGKRIGWSGNMIINLVEL